METFNEADVRTELRTDIRTFIGLLVGLLLIIAVRCAPLHMDIKVWVGGLLMLSELALIVYYFFHLSGKKLVILVLLILTFFFAFSILFWPAWDQAYSVRNSRDVKGI